MSIWRLSCRAGATSLLHLNIHISRNVAPFHCSDQGFLFIRHVNMRSEKPTARVELMVMIKIESTRLIWRNQLQRHRSLRTFELLPSWQIASPFQAACIS